MRNTILFTVVIWTFGGCSGTTDVLVDDLSQPRSDASETDLTADIPTVFPDVVIMDTVKPDLFPDVPGSEMSPEFVGCEGPEGCLLDPCDGNDDCQSGFCVHHLGDKVCTETCIEECPDGWNCQQVTGMGPDVLFLCVSQFAHLCQPCASSEDCTDPSGVADVCVEYEDQGSFCGGPCGGDAPCPEGYECKQVTSSEGAISNQCVAATSVCQCSAVAAKLGMSTPCTVENEFGQCQGQRICTVPDAAIDACDAMIPTAEQCNGQDDNCDGQIDEATCDDGNPCTADVCDGEAGCSHQTLEGTECTDGDICTLSDHCVDGVCKGTQINCEDGNPCTDDLCDEAEGCVFQDNSLECDDGDPCTFGDLCKAGECVSGVKVSCDDGNPCTLDSCHQQDGCVHEDQAGSCDDGNDCTLGDHCENGLCVWGESVDCDDANPCTDDSCIPGQGCVNNPNNQFCDDGDSCTLKDQCLDAACQPGQPVNCDDSNPCTDDSCNKLVGCVHTANNDPCEDGDPCTLTDSCSGGTCVGTGLKDCADENPCTDDFCIPMAGCSHSNNSAPCNDGSVCTSGDYCAGGSCVPGDVTVCNDGNPCTQDGCDPVNGCTQTPKDGACDDNNLCTNDDQCVDGICKGFGMADCDDSNPCTTDVCLPEGGCAHNPWQGPCSDGDVCTLNDQCEAGTCVAGPQLPCSDSNPCTVDSCDPQKGCQFVPDDLADCSDGNECTVEDHCLDGLCVYASLAECDDQNVCTTDYCKPDTGCAHDLNQGPCDDGDVCTVSDQCSLGECKSAGQLNCNDGNPCTDDICDPGNGCEFVPNQDLCDDTNECTSGDQCSGGICAGPLAVDCNDLNPCTDDGCTPAAGCFNNPNNLPCSDGDACTTDDVCAQGGCVGQGALDCDDNDVCTDDSCDELLGCVYENNTAPCSDGDPCTPVDGCQDGLCVGTGLKNCDDSNPCTDDSCEPFVGCAAVANSAACTDENECTTGDTCVDSECVTTGVLVCDDLDKCTADTCSPSQGCVFTDITPCCGNGQVEPPEECDDGNDNDGDSCNNLCQEKSQVEHFDGFNFFYNDHPQDTHNKQRAIEACQNHTGKSCHDGYGQCGNARYVSFDTSCTCNGQRLWYYGVDNGGFIWGGDVAGGTAIKCSQPDKNWY